LVAVDFALESSEIAGESRYRVDGLAVILINWRQEERTLRCVRAVAGWHALKPRVIVVDNESTEATYGALSAAVPDENLICSAANHGYAGGNNLGIKRALAAEPEFVLLLNTDVDISSAAVAQLLAKLNAYTQIAIIGPVVNESDDSQIERYVGGRDIARHSLTRIAMSSAHNESLPGYPIHAVDHVSGTVILARATVFKEIRLSYCSISIIIVRICGQRSRRIARMMLGSPAGAAAIKPCARPRTRTAPHRKSGCPEAPPIPSLC